MAMNEYKLSYTAEEIDKRLGDIATNASNIANIQTNLDKKADSSSLNNYYTKTEVNDMELITTDEIDNICSSVI